MLPATHQHTSSRFLRSGLTRFREQGKFCRMTEPAETKQRIDELRAEIERHNRLYYIDAAPQIADRDYDQLLESLEQLEKQFPEHASTTSPTQRVGGAPLEGFENVKHAVPMLSLKNADAKKPTELSNFVSDAFNDLGSENINFVMEPKIDGISISLRYEKGSLVQALTRGDGDWGDDVTANARTIRSIPLKLKGVAPTVLEVRGEVYMSVSGFSKFNAERQENGLEVFANPRNACAGTMKLLNPTEVSKRPLDAIFYGTGELNGIDFSTHVTLLEKLSDFGLRTCPKKWVCKTLDEIRTHLDELDNMRDNFDFAIDGCVIKINQRRYYEQLGYRSKSPKWAIAYKYEPEQAKTRLLSITIQVGRTGVLTPVAELEPVLLAGTTVKRATLHNLDEIRRKGIKIGDHVVIEKAGEIIPAVVQVLVEERTGNECTFEMPTQCPDCGTEVEQKEGEVAIRCMNLQCPAQLKSWLEHFSSKGALDIEGIGGIVADKLIEEKLVTSPLDLFSVDTRTLSKLNLGTTSEPRIFGRKNATKVIRALENSKSKSFGKWLFALGIPKIGSVSALNIAQQHNSMLELMNSRILYEFVELFDLQSEMSFVNPQSTNNPCKTTEEREKRTQRVEEINTRMAEVAPNLSSINWISQVDDLSRKPTPICLRHQYTKTDSAPNPEAVRSLHRYVKSESGANTISRLNSLNITFETKEKGSRLSGKKFVITGTLIQLSRNDAKDLILSQGGSVSGSVSKNTDFLVAGDKAGSKLDMAKKLGVEILSEDQLISMASESTEAEKKSPPTETDLFGDPL